MQRLSWTSRFGQSLLLLALGLSSFVAAQDDNKASSAKQPATHTVKAERFRIELKLSGTFESARTVEVALRPKAWTKLEVKQAVAHGTAVKKGDRLVELDLVDLKRSIKSAEQALVIGKLGLDEARVSLDAQRKTTPIELAAAERSAKNADDDLKYFLEVDRDRSIKSAERSLKSSQYALEYAAEELNQLRQMYKADDLTEETEEIILKRAERSVEAAEFSLESTKLRTSRTLKTTIPRQETELVESTKRQAFNLAKTVTTTSAALKKAEIGLEKLQIEHAQAEEKLAELKADLKTLSDIHSPIDGFVYFGRIQKGKWSGVGAFEAALQPGGTITSGKVFMTIVSPDVARVRASVSEKDLFQVREGITGKGTPTAFPDMKFGLKVSSIGRIPSAPGQFECVIDLTNGPESSVVAGMGCQVSLITYDQADALCVPAESVFSDVGEDEQYVFVAGDGHTRQPVKTGRRSGERIEIVSGLKAGDKILVKKPEGE
ncbi:MAG: efflux RND transporter periplasmic adaptor subunit [Planctomycetota bacterium]